jgi:diguanylate cyclase (GGDEF)-like protein
MALTEQRGTLDATLGFAADLCLGLGAFVVALTGTVRVGTPDSIATQGVVRRIEVLARSCLAHPAAHGRDIFWNAELSTEAESAEKSFACVVMPMWSGGTQTGLLGVVDTWLPEPDADQRDALGALAAELAGTIGTWLADVPVATAPAAAAALGGPTAPHDAGSSCPPDEGLGGGEQAGLFSAVLHHLPEPVVVSRIDGGIVYANEAFSALSGYGEEALLGLDPGALLAPLPGRGTDGGGSVPAIATGSRRCVLVTSSGDVTAVGVHEDRFACAGAVYTVSVVRALGGSTALSGEGTVIDAADLVANLEDGILCLDATGTVVIANRAADALHGLPRDRSLVGSPLPMVTALRTEDGQVLAHDDHPGLRVLREGVPCAAHLTLGSEGEGRRHMQVSARPLLVGDLDGSLVVLHDTTAERAEQERLTHYALHDPLTSLANRYLLLEELRRMLQGLLRRGGSVALVFLDLDDFKRINDEHGHDVGDEVLASVARRLQGAVRSDDVVARLGGDEFVIAHASAERLPDGDLVVSRLRKVLSAPFRLRGHVFDVGASVGWVSTDTPDVGPDALLAEADRAMYRHKRDRSMARRGAA